MTARERLPERRSAETFDLLAGGLKYVCTVGRFADSRIGELCGIDAKLERSAARFESRSRWLRALIGRLEVPSPAVLKEFAGPEDTEQAAVFWDSLNDLLDESDLPLSRAAHRLASLLQEYR